MAHANFSSPEELNRILKLFNGCQEFDDFERTLISTEEKWKSKLNNAAEYRLCRLHFEHGSFPVAIPESVTNNLTSIRLTSRITAYRQNERIVVKITKRFPATSPIAEGVIEGRYSNDKKYSMLPKAGVDRILQRKPGNFRACQLQLEGSQQGWAVPVEASDELERVELKGRSNCGRACNGDTVLVEVLEKDEENPKLGHGRVVGVLRQQEKLIYKLFVCELIYDEGCYMRPLCQSFPKISCDNKFAQQWYREQYERSTYCNRDFQARRSAGVQNRDETILENIEKYANLHYVSVYNPHKRLVDGDGQEKKRNKKSQGKGNEKALFEFTPYGRPLQVQKHNCDKLFIVCYLRWPVDQFYPWGRVVHVFNRVDTIENTLEVLILKHSLPRKLLETPPVKNELDKLSLVAKDISDHATRRDYRDHFTVTIDNPETKDMDDAISFKYNAQTRIAIIGVHITDVTYYIQKDSVLDRLARNRVVTIYPPKIAKQRGITPNHLFPSLLSESLLSLVEGADRRCLSTIFEFKRDPTGEWDLRKRTPAMTLIRSNHRLNKETVHEILLGKEPKDGKNYSIELISALRHLWGIAKELRLYRMGSAAFVSQDKSDDSTCIGDKFEASALVEEFMVLANRTVGEFLASSKYVEPFAVRVQEPPRDVDVEVWRCKFEFAVFQSSQLTKYFRNLSLKPDPRTARQNIRVHKDDSQLVKKLCSEDPRGALLMFFSETRFPFLFLAITAWHGISRPADYLEFQSQRPNLHFDLNTVNYVHFTSPLRRYADVLVHRALRAQLEGQVQGKVEPILDLTHHMNSVVLRSKRFEKDCRCFEFAELNKTSPQCLLAIIKDVSDDAIVFTSSASYFLPSVSNSMPLRFLGLSEKPTTSNEYMGLRWKKRIFCHPSSERYSNFISEGIEAEKNSDVTISNTEYFVFIDFNQTMAIKDQFVRCQGNYDDVRQLCEKLADKVVCESDKSVNAFFVSSEARFRESSIIKNSSHIKKEVRLGDVMKVQYYNVTNNGLLMPTIQMIELCETVDMCVAHRMRPVASFEHTAEEPCVDAYEDVEHYARVWLPIVSMESATVAAAADDSFVIHDVELKWKFDDKNNKLLGLFCLSEEYCQERSIRFSDSVYSDPMRKEKLQEHAETGIIKDASDEAFAIAESMKLLRYAEYICLRSKKDSYTWIGHGGIVAVYNAPHTKSVMCGASNVHMCRFIVFHLNEVSCDSKVAQRDITRASLEIVYKFLPSRRQEIAVQMLGDVDKYNIASKLIRVVNAERIIDHAGDWTTYFNHFLLKGIHNFKIKIPNGISMPCNDSQHNAIISAMKMPVTLIWGPPGTGKTSTGVMLTYWFVFVNRCIDDTWNDVGNYSDDVDEDEDEIDAADAHVRIDYSELGIQQHQKFASGFGLRSQARTQTSSGFSGPKKHKELQARRQVLYCGPSNASVDVVANYLMHRLKNLCPRIVRVASEQAELRKYPVPGEGLKSKVNAETEISPQLQQITLHEVVRTGNGKRARLLKSFDMLFGSFLEKKIKSASVFHSILLAVSQQCKDLYNYLMLHLPEYTLLKKDTRRNEPLKPWDMDMATVTRLYRLALADAKSVALQRFEVVLCTTSVSSSGLLQKSCKFSQIIIDEAGMCTQPETLVPIVGYIKTASVAFIDEDGTPVPLRLASHHAERVVLIGDHKQLCPIIQNKTAELLGLRKSFLEYHSESMVMLQYQYRMHPSLADFPAEFFYNVDNSRGSGQEGPSSGLQTRCSSSWTGIRRSGYIRADNQRFYWTGLNTHLVAEDSAYTQMSAVNANILHGCWPGVRTRAQCRDQGYVYSTLPDAKADELHPRGEEERIVFLHIAGKEERTTVASDEGHEDSRCNLKEAETVVRIYKSIVARLHGRRMAEGTIGVLSQYRYQVSRIRQMLQQADIPNPIVQTVIASQGSEFDYVILSLVRSLPDYEIPQRPLPGWEKKYLGFITDENQINVALTRARRGLIIIGNRNLLRTNRMWSCLLDRLQTRGCIPAHPDDFPDRTGDQRPMTRCAGHPDLRGLHFVWREDQQCFYPSGATRDNQRDAQRDWVPLLSQQHQQHHQQRQQQGGARATSAAPPALAAPGAFGVRRHQPLQKPFSIQNEDFPELR